MPKRFEAEGTIYELIELGKGEIPGHNSVVKIVGDQDQDRQYIANITMPQRFLEPIKLEIIKEIR